MRERKITSHIDKAFQSESMAQRSVQTYTIAAQPADSNRNRVKIPTNGNDIRIIISEPSPPSAKVDQKSTMPTIEIIENSTHRDSPLSTERYFRPYPNLSFLIDQKFEKASSQFCFRAFRNELPEDGSMEKDRVRVVVR